MKLSFRWYGDSDPVTLEYIRQIPGMEVIVSAIYDVPVGEVWSEDKIKALAEKVEAAGLKLDVIESVPVHEGHQTRQAEPRPISRQLLPEHQKPCKIRRKGHLLQLYAGIRLAPLRFGL